jgi:hypothetical protein
MICAADGESQLFIFFFLLIFLGRVVWGGERKINPEFIWNLENKKDSSTPQKKIINKERK